MNDFKNEQGAALVLTLLLVTLFLVFMTGLFYQVTNTAKHVSTMDEHINARHVAEMGVTYFEQSIRMEKDNLEQVLQDDGEEALMAYIGTFSSNLTKHVPIDENRSFAISVQSIVNKTTENEPGQIEIKFNSAGEAFDRSEEIENDIVIVLDENAESE